MRTVGFSGGGVTGDEDQLGVGMTLEYALFKRGKGSSLKLHVLAWWEY